MEVSCARCFGLPAMGDRLNAPGHWDHRAHHGGKCYSTYLGAVCRTQRCADLTRCRCGGPRYKMQCQAPDPVHGPDGGTVIPCATCGYVYHPTCHYPPITALQARNDWQGDLCHAEYHKLRRLHHQRAAKEAETGRQPTTHTEPGT